MHSYVGCKYYSHIHAFTEYPGVLPYSNHKMTVLKSSNNTCSFQFKIMTMILLSSSK